MKKVTLVLLRNLSEDDKKFIKEKIGRYAEVYFLDELDPEDPIVGVAEIAIVSMARAEKTRRILANAKNLKFIQTLVAGVDNLPFNDLPRNVVIASNAGANAEEVAEFAVALTLAAAKNIVLFDREMRKGIWRNDTPHLIRDSVIMILGYGKIGREVAKRLRPFRPKKIIGVNRRGFRDEYIDEVIKPSKIYDIIGEVDILISTLPLNKETWRLINKGFLERMKRNAILVNVGRGPVIDEKALYTHLKENPEFKAAIDVWWRYPSKRGEETYQNLPFHKLDNIIMTPHMAGAWEGFRRKLLSHALENVLKYLEGDQISNEINIRDYI